MKFFMYLVMTIEHPEYKIYIRGNSGYIAPKIDVFFTLSVFGFFLRNWIKLNTVLRLGNTFHLVQNLHP